MLFNELNLTLSQHQLEQFEKYYELLVQWNEKFNLTAITDEEGVYIKHFYDSLLLTNYQLEGSLCDVGSGAGFPGIPLKIVYPELAVTLIEPTGKRCTFLNEVISQLDLQNIEVINMRSEDYHEKAFDFVTARAVAQLNILCELCLPLVSIGGRFLAMKGPNAFEEVEAAHNAITKLGGKLESIDEYLLPNGDKRMIVNILKEKETPAGYPRSYSRIKKKPL